MRGEWVYAGTKVLCKILEVALLGAALWGMVLAWKTSSARPLILVLLYMNIHVLTIGDPRYTMPVLPLLNMFSAFGLIEAARRAGLVRGEAHA